MLPTLLLLLQSAGDPGPVYDGRARRLDVHPPRIDTTVTIDGRLNEAVWGRAAVLTGFSEYRPADSRPAADSTQVLVWYAPDAIYFGVRAFEAHGAVVRATLADRDNIDRDDRIHILLDTFHDHRRALLFAVNPLGVQQDGVLSDGVDAGAAGGPSAGGRFDATIDLNPDFVFQSRGRVTPWGFEVRSEEHTSELQSRVDLVCRLLLEKTKTMRTSLIFTKTKINKQQKHNHKHNA